MDNTMFTIIPTFIFIIFIAMLCLIIYGIIKSIGTWNHNNAQPKLTVSAKIVSKREDISTHLHNDADNFSHSGTSTTYYVTFELDNKDRMEFHVNGSEYGLLVEQDNGNLTFQGTRYLGFKRTL